MDFLVSQDAPFAVRIRGVAYSVPRFLGPALREWGAKKRKENEDHATRDLPPEHKARLLLIFQHPPIDVKQLLSEAITSDGSEYVVRRQLKLGGVPDDLIEEIVNHDDPLLVRNLAEELTMLPAAGVKIDAIAGVENPGDGPLTQSPPPTGGAPSTGTSSTPASEQPTPEPIQTESVSTST